MYPCLLNTGIRASKFKHLLKTLKYKKYLSRNFE